MAENPGLTELLRAFNEAGVEYLIVGGYAVMKYTDKGGVFRRPPCEIVARFRGVPKNEAGRL